MKYIYGILTSLLLGVQQIFAINQDDLGFRGDASNGSILDVSNNGITFVSMLTIVQSVLLKLVLPIVIIGASLYIAYELFTAEGDESRLKKAWKSIAYTAIALIAIALSYATISIISRLSI